MEERLGEMRKGRRERIEKGIHCFFKSSGLEHKHKNLEHTISDCFHLSQWESTHSWCSVS